MAWTIGNIPNSTKWEYNITPLEPPTTNLGQHGLWSKQTAGIRTVTYEGGGTLEIYTECRLIASDVGEVGSPITSMGELNKTFYDNL